MTMHPIHLERERGFTLIELLVVMIIIAILMAVAVPTFLSQKNTALKTQATANIKQIINAVESCATNIPQGGYVDPTTGGLNCTTPTILIGFEKSLTNLNLQAEAPGATAQDVGKFQINLDTATNQGYMVQTMIQDSGQAIYFAEVHAANGGLFKVCKADAAFSNLPNTGVEGYTVVGAPAPQSKTCKTGKW